LKRDAAAVIGGGCFCGAVRFRFGAAPVALRSHWCRDCQYLACGNASVNAIFRSDGLEVTGELAAYESRADSGSVMTRSFCPRCGTQLFSQAAIRPDVMVVRVGSCSTRRMRRPRNRR
jgi:hypothetical protein